MGSWLHLGSPDVIVNNAKISKRTQDTNSGLLGEIPVLDKFNHPDLLICGLSLLFRLPCTLKSDAKELPGALKMMSMGPDQASINWE